MDCFRSGGFQNAKRRLAAGVPLQHLAPNAELSLATDASDTYIGRVMQQKSETIGRPLGFFSRKQTQNHVIQLLTANYWPLRQQLNISVISVKVALGPIINPWLLLFPAFQPPFHLDNNVVWRLSQSSMSSCWICQV